MFRMKKVEGRRNSRGICQKFPEKNPINMKHRDSPVTDQTVFKYNN